MSKPTRPPRSIMIDAIDYYGFKGDRVLREAIFKKTLAYDCIIHWHRHDWFFYLDSLGGWRYDGHGVAV